MVDFVPGRAVIDAAQCKRGKYMDRCAAIGYAFLLFSFSSLGELEAATVILLKRIRKFSITQDIGARAAIHIFNRIGFAIAKEVGAQIVSRPPSNFLLIDFVPGRAVSDAEHRKRVKYVVKCADIGYGFLPFSFSSFGKLEKDAVTLQKRIRKFSVAQDIRARAAIHIFSRISFVIAKEVGAQIEVDIGLDGGRDKPLRPADMLLYSWDGGLDVCVDLTGFSPLTQTGMVDFVPGRAVIDVAQRKREADAVTLLKRIRKFSITQDIGARTAIHILNRISFAIAKGVEAQIVLKLSLQIELLRARPTTLGEAFSLARIIEARFEAIAKKEKEWTIKKADVILSLQSELTSLEIKESLDADEDISVDEVSSAIDDVFDIRESNVESMEVRSKFGEFSENKKSVEEVVVGGGEAFGVDEVESNRVISVLKDGGGEFDDSLDEKNLGLSEEFVIRVLEGRDVSDESLVIF
ncbi:hypothetical protein Tco_1278612 [Tanacetum coccineum]